MTQSNEDRITKIQRLLAMAERGATEAERDAFNAKATALMIEWAIDDAQLKGDDRPVDEIVTQVMVFADVPKSYSHEYTQIGIRVANALGAKGMYQPTRTEGTRLYVVAYASDLTRIRMLTASLTVQCTAALAAWWRSNSRFYVNGTDRFNAKRSFIRGFADGLKVKLTTVYRDTVASAGHGAELVLVDRRDQVLKFAEAHMDGRARSRKYHRDGWSDGNQAGQRANVGQTQLGKRLEIGR